MEELASIGNYQLINYFNKEYKNDICIEKKKKKILCR